MDFTIFKSECQAFIFNWSRVSDNAKKLQKQFNDLGIETYVINSDESENDNALENWVNIGESGYMVQQYAKGIDSFNKTYFLEMFADIYDVEAELILKRAYYTFTKYDCGVYTPDVYYIYGDFDRKKLPKIETHLYEVPNPESLLSFIHKDIIEELILDPVKYSIGWGIDFSICALAQSQNKLVIKDYKTTIRHVRSTGYAGDEARKEMQMYIQDQKPEIAVLIRALREKANGLLLGGGRKKELKRKLRSIFIKLRILFKFKA